MSKKVAALKTHKRRLLKEYRKERRTFRIKLVTGRHVIFIYQGEEIDFIYKEGRTTRGPLSKHFLPFDDWAFLFTLAEELMRACIAGYQDGRQSEREQTPKEALDALEALNPRQQSLF